MVFNCFCKLLIVKTTIKLSLHFITISLLLMSLFISNAFTKDDSIHNYIDQANGANRSTTTGSEADPFKSITYSILKNKNTSEPLFLHIKSGVYDADPSKKANEREIFPIELKNGMTIQGDDGVDNCIFNSNSKAAILRGEYLSDILIKNLTLKNMHRTSGGNGGGCEFIRCSGKVEQCIIQNNKAGDGGGIRLTVPNGDFFYLSENIVTGNTALSGKGGGLYIASTFKGDISSNTFNDNSAKDGSGGGFCISGDLYGNILDNQFNNNSATSSDGTWGGGFHVNAIFGNIQGNVYNNNSSSNSGGGFYSNYLYGDLINNSFNDNSAKWGGAFFVHITLVGNITTNIFNNNSATNYVDFESDFLNF